MEGTSISYAKAKDWLDIMKNRSKVRMHELIERLGLRAKWSSNKRGKTNFESALVRDLVADMGDVVATLPKESDELMKFLSEEGSLKEEVDGLLEKHGSKIWGRAGDREHLITANEPGVDDGLYTRDLVFENEEDKELIHKLLHWWIGLKACNVILARERLDRERRKKAENRQARAEAEQASQHGDAPASFVALAPNSVLHDIDTGSRGSPMSSSAMLTPPESGESPVVGPRDGSGFSAIHDGGAANAHASHAGQHQNIVEGVWSRFAAADRNASREAAAPWQPRNGLHPDSKAAAQQQIALSEQAAAERQITENVAQLVAGFREHAVPEKVPQAGISIPYRGLDYDSLRALRSYIYNEEAAAHIDEEALLNKLERIWREGVRADLEKLIANVPVFVARERAFLTWIELKRHVAAFERAERRWASEGTTDAEFERRQRQYHTLMGATETILVNFEDVGQFGVGPGLVDRDELLRQAIVVLAGEKYAVEMQWKSIEFTATVRWLADHLDAFRKDEEEESRSTLWYVG
ncbi:hypothetical protein FB567DRAFT_331855 [Paraphoma chrysanthemicola]|uniref:Uncharacterized protein n=1 Tax=Paraphoma chrysanthemicola TaxID=798071 RepID=A0A8K0R8T1_9PLEO|nr:hypothetical protein FB567DRAFT_331855 [Paraphoma chrysanthemicola]